MKDRVVPLAVPHLPVARSTVKPCLLSNSLSELLFLVKASRPGFWLTAVWFYLLPLGSHIRLDSPLFWLGLIYIGFPLGMMIYAGTDVTDELTDSLNPRKDTFLFGARPTPEQIKSLPGRIFWIQLPFIVAFTWLLGPKALLWFAALVGGVLLYNRYCYRTERFVGLDVLAQVGYLLVFVLANWLNGLPTAPWTIFAFGALFAMHSHLFGQVMDIEPDAAANRYTTAVVIGVGRVKMLMVLALCIETFLATYITEKPWLAPFLALAALWFAFDGLVLWRKKPYAPWQMTLFFLGWNALLCFEIGLSAYWRHFRG